jgi:pimeloyl-ACP methyl ester carboxylesterase
VADFQRGRLGALPYAATGAGRPVVVLSGLAHVTGVAGDGFVAGILAPVLAMADHRRLYAVNRRPHLPNGMTMAELAAEHAEGMRERFGEPVDVVGVSTGGSIAQQLAADHPDVVRRLVVASSGCRLGPAARAMQARVGEQVRAGDLRGAGATALASLLPGPVAPLGRGLGWLGGAKVLAEPGTRTDLAVTVEAEDGFDLAALAPIQAPTLLVGGGRDRFYPVALFRETRALIPDCRLELFPRRGHITVLQDKGARAAIAHFLDS